MDWTGDVVPDLPDPAAADILEHDDAYLLVIDLPGATAEHTSISTTDGSVSVSTDRTPDIPGESTVIREERPRQLAFEIPLPNDAEVETARASLSNGVLEITIPRGDPGVTIPIEEG